MVTTTLSLHAHLSPPVDGAVLVVFSIDAFGVSELGRSPQEASGKGGFCELVFSAAPHAHLTAEVLSPSGASLGRLPTSLAALGAAR